MTTRIPCRRSVLALLAAIATMTAVRGQVPDPRLVVATALDSARARIGDRLTLEVSLTGPADISLARPIVGTTLGVFHVAEVTARPPRRSDGQWTQGWTLRMTTFAHGPQAIPRITVEGQFLDGRAFSATSDGEVTVAIETPSATAVDELRPVTAVIEVPAGLASQAAEAVDWLAVSIVVAVVVLVASAWPYLSRWHYRRLFWRRLIAEAHALRRADVGAVRDQYTMAAVLLRRGVGRSIDQLVDSYTTTEMIVCVSALGATGARIGPALWTVMNHLDEVRFSGTLPDDRTKNRALDEVIAMLRALSAIAMAAKRIRS